MHADTRNRDVTVPTFNLTESSWTYSIRPMSYMGPISARDVITIQPRNRKFSRTAPKEHWWLNGDPIATAFYNAMSAAFPIGEAFFVESMGKFKGDVSPQLATEIKAFVQQEMNHAREHMSLNKSLVEGGYDIEPLEERVTMRLNMLREKGAIACLCGTIATEHLTAIFAHELLSNARHMRGADPELAPLWVWHCQEEIEHKGVAFDTWREATKDWTDWKRWSVRCKLMLFLTRRFVWDRLCGIIELLRQDGITGPKAWARTLWFAFGYPGMMRRILQGLPVFFKPGFHPWDHDDRHLIEAAADIEAKAA